jgi:hypothetical protein
MILVLVNDIFSAFHSLLTILNQSLNNKVSDISVIMALLFIVFDTMVSCDLAMNQQSKNLHVINAI